MVHRQIQNIPVQNVSNRPVSPTGPICTSPRLVRNHTYLPAYSSFPPGSPTKRNMPYPIPLSNTLQLPMQQLTPFAHMSSSGSLQRTHSQISFDQPPTSFEPSPSPTYQAPFNNTYVSPELTADAQLVLNSLGSPTLLLPHTSMSRASSNTVSNTNFPTSFASKGSSAPVTLYHDEDDDDEGSSRFKALPDDTSDELPPVDSVFHGVQDPVVLSNAPIASTGALPVRTFEITFNVYQLKVLEADSVAGRTKKARGRAPKVAPKAVKPQWRNFKPIVPTYSKLPVGSFSWSDWRTKLFEACNKRLMGISKALAAAERSGTLAIQGSVTGTDRKKTKQRVYLTDDITFGEFVHAILAAPSNAVVYIKIVHPNPKTNEDANRSLASTLRASGANSPSDPSDDEDGSESDGSDQLTSAEKNYKTLMARFEKAFKSGENVATAVNPKDTSQVLLLNTARIRTWANDWADGVPGVDEVNPPMARPNFNWVPASDYEDKKADLLGLRDHCNRPSKAQPAASNSAGTVIHHNYYGQGFPSPGVPSPSPFSTPNLMMPPPPPSSNSSPVDVQPHLSIPPNVEKPDFESFLMFSGIHEGMKKTRDVLQKEGIDDFARLLDRQTYSIHNLHGMGIPFAHADDIFKAVPKFIDTLKPQE